MLIAYDCINRASAERLRQESQFVTCLCSTVVGGQSGGATEWQRNLAGGKSAPPPDAISKLSGTPAGCWIINR